MSSALFVLTALAVASTAKAEPPVLGLTPPPPPPLGQHYHYEKFYPEPPVSPVISAPDHNIVKRPLYPQQEHQPQGTSFVYETRGKNPVHQKPSTLYGPPVVTTTPVPKPPIVYGPPAPTKPSKVYGPPHLPPSTPSPVYGPPADFSSTTFSTIYGPPAHLPPSTPSSIYGPPNPDLPQNTPSTIYGPPNVDLPPKTPSTIYGPPNVDLPPKTPSKIYGPPDAPLTEVPPAVYGPPQHPPQKPSHTYIPPEPTTTSSPPSTGHPGYSYKVPSQRLSYSNGQEQGPVKSSNPFYSNRFSIPKPSNRQRVSRLSLSFSRLMRSKSSNAYLPSEPSNTSYLQ